MTTSPETPIYLDHNATTPILPEVLDAMLPYLRQHYGNPQSGHTLGQVARQAVEEARGEVAALLSCAADEVLFTSGGTEANNLAIRGVLAAIPAAERRQVITSAIEHPATAAPCRHLAQEGLPVAVIAVDAAGQVRVDDVAEQLEAGGGATLLTVMHANNETGVLQPIRRLADLAHARGALLHSDAAQSPGKVPVAVDELGVDLLSLAGHKLYAPKGVGALYVRRGTPLAPLLLGAGHERGLRPGTENVASIVGLGVACRAARRDLAAEAGRQRALRDRLFALLSGLVPGLRCNGHAAERLPNTLSVRFPGVTGAALLHAVPAVAASTGSACHAGVEHPSGVLLAMGIPAAEAVGTVRLTLGRGTDAAAVEQAAAALGTGWTGLATRR